MVYLVVLISDELNGLKREDKGLRVYDFFFQITIYNLECPRIIDEGRFRVNNVVYCVLFQSKISLSHFTN